MSSIVITIPNQVPRKYAVPESFTYRELQTIKNVTGLRPAEFEDALESGDPDIVIALAVICAQRAGHAITADDLMDLEVGAQPSIADYAVFYVEYWKVNRLKEELPANLAAHYKRMRARPAVEKAIKMEGLA
jgi:glutathione S-transferase